MQTICTNPENSSVLTTYSITLPPYETFSLYTANVVTNCDPYKTTMGTTYKKSGKANCEVRIFCDYKDSSNFQAASANEIVARTILREAYQKGQAAYEAVAWNIYNRVKSGKFPKSDPKSICLQTGQYQSWRSYWGQSEVPVNPVSTSDPDYAANLVLANRIVAGLPPKMGTDPISGYLFFLQDTPDVRKNHSPGISIGGNWFFNNW